MLEKGDYFTLFGLPQTFTQDLSQIKSRYHRLQQKMHPDNFVHATPQEKRIAVEFAATINEAYRTLITPLKRAIYLLKVRGVDIQSETDTNMPIEFLMQQMEMRERLADGEVLQVKEEVRAKLMESEAKLSELLDAQNTPLPLAREEVRKMLFYVRLNEEIIEKDQS
ncbi:MAG: Fe-S protein assembly co-chaperone HscB [Gammaproteobacteria bacterium]|jgi:molecular chaperone HscB|nr:Fe-S protein assembly co-chaperone HscB [Gammaproteobacteria bacterium]